VPICAAGSVGETKDLYEKLAKHVSRDEYLSLIGTHAFGSYQDILAAGKRIQESFSSGNHYQSGVETGKTFNFILLHDFFFDHSGYVPSSKDLFFGYINGSYLLEYIPSLAVCDPVSAVLRDNVTEFIHVVKNITKDNFQEMISKLFPLGNAIFNELVDNLSSCTDIVADTTIFVQKLTAHISKDGYFNKIVSHAMSNAFPIMQSSARIQSVALPFDLGFEVARLIDFIFLHDFDVTPKFNVALL